MMPPFPTNHPTWIVGVYLLKFTNKYAYLLSKVKGYRNNTLHNYGATWRPA
jgi:hypothetical protein